MIQVFCVCVCVCVCQLGVEWRSLRHILERNQRACPGHRGRGWQPAAVGHSQSRRSAESGQRTHTGGKTCTHTTRSQKNKTAWVAMRMLYCGRVFWRCILWTGVRREERTSSSLDRGIKPPKWWVLFVFVLSFHRLLSVSFLSPDRHVFSLPTRSGTPLSTGRWPRSGVTTGSSTAPFGRLTSRGALLQPQVSPQTKPRLQGFCF